MHPPRKRLAGELVFVIGLLVFSLFMLWTAYGISKFESLTSAGAFPMVATGVMVLCALQIVRRTLGLERAEAEPGESIAKQFVRRLTPTVVLTFTAAIAAYMLLLQPLGFLLSSYLFLVISMALLGSRRWGLNLLVSALALAAIYLIFQTVFSVVLPSGSWLQGVLK
jgi:putative tricarboxylic transport membrane protein